MTNKIHEQECPSCGAMMRFDPATGKLVCDYCGTTVEIEASAPKQSKSKKGENVVEDAVSGFDFHALLEQKTDANAEQLPVYNCVSCGAEVIAPAEQMALTCPYCRNNIVLTEKTTGNLRPDGVIPFAFSSEQLPQMMKEFYKNKKLLPDDFFSVGRMQNITGIYVPFWVFDGKADGRFSYQGETISVTTRGDTEYTTRKYYALNNEATLGFQNLPVDASEKVDDDRMGALEPFDMSQAKAFHMSYLAGFTADRFDVAANSMAKRAEERMKLTCKSVATAHVRQTSSYENIRSTGGNITIRELNAKYILFPVYMFDLTYEDQVYPFAVNGQTGKIVGEVPTSKAVTIRYFLLRFVPLLIVIIVFFLVKYLMGR